MKKFIFTLITVICTAVFAFGLVACNGNDKHTWSTEWSSNGANHWHNCTDSGCKQRSDLTPHTWFLTSTIENPTCTDDGTGIYTCIVCSRTKTDTIETSGHNWVLFKAEYPATCITEGRGTFRCADCAVTQDKMTIPATGVHDYSTTWTRDDKGHYHVCKTVGCGATTESINHVESGNIRVEAGDYVDGSDQTRCVDCNYLLSSSVRPAKNVPVSFDVQFGSTLPVDGAITLSAGSTYTMSYPNAVNGNGELISNMPYLNGGIGVAIYSVTKEEPYTESQITYDSEEKTSFTTNGGKLYPKLSGNYTLIFKFMVSGVVKISVTIKVTVL